MMANTFVSLGAISRWRFLFGKKRKEKKHDFIKKIVDIANREIAMPIESSSSGQIAYKYANCPNCGSGNSYLEGRANCYCPRCGQKLIWVVHEKN